MTISDMVNKWYVKYPATALGALGLWAGAKNAVTTADDYLTKNPPQGQVWEASADYLNEIREGIENTLYAEVINLNVRPDNYLDTVKSFNDCIVMYNHKDVYVEEGEKFVEKIDQNFSERIPVLRIEMGSWPDSAVYDWIEEQNEKNILPSYHIFIDGQREVRIRGPPARFEFHEWIRKIDNYLKKRDI